MKLVVVLVSLFLVSSYTYALPQESGFISFLQIHQNPVDKSSRYIVRISGATATENNCGGDEWTGLLETEGDKAMYSTILASHLSGQEIRLQGTSADTCVGNGLLIRNLYGIW